MLPIIRDFDPEVILVAAGFDAACGHPAPLGGYRISPACMFYLPVCLISFKKKRS